MNKIVAFFNKADIFGKKPKLRYIALTIAVLLILSRVFLYVAYIVYGACVGKNIDFVSFLLDIQHNDAQWYNSIIESGYNVVDELTGRANWAFFPMVPLLIKGLQYVIPINAFILGSFVNTIILFFTSLLVYKYIVLTRDNSRLALFIIFILIFGPYSWYCSIFYTESLFLFLLILILYCLKTKKYILMGVMGMLFSATRNTGVFILFTVLAYIIMEYVRSDNPNKSVGNFFTTTLSNTKLVLSVSLIPIGIFSYMLFLYFHLGDGLAFIRIQSAWGRQFIGLFRSLYEGALYMPIIFIITIFSFFFIGYLCYERRYDEAIFPLIVIIVGGVSSLMSMHRFIFSTLTVSFGFSDFIYRNKYLNKTYIKIPVLIILFGLEIALFYKWSSASWTYYVF